MQTFNIDIAQSPAPLVLYAKQGDSLSRFFQINFLQNGQPWIPPAGALFAVRYGVPGLPSGWYDTIQEQDGSSHSAFGLLGNALTVELAYEAVSAFGRNSLCVLVLDANGYQLGTWNLALQVEITPGENAPESTQYYSLLSAQVAQVLASVTDAENAATLAESWAVGGTGTREGEDTNNAEYWAGRAAASAGQSLGFRTFSAAVSPDPATGDVDPTSPMLMANLTATSAADRLDHVVVPGKTTQAGSGDPSPSNVRALSGVGRKMVELVCDGTETWYEDQVLSSYSSTYARYNLRGDQSLPKYAAGQPLFCPFLKNYPTTYYPNNPVPGAGVYGVEGKLFDAVVLKSDYPTVANWKEQLAAWASEGKPAQLYYTPVDESQATGWYTWAAVSGDTYAAVGLPLNGPLYDGDKVSNNEPTGCDVAVTFDGSEDESWRQMETSTSGKYRYNIALPNAVQADTDSGVAYSDMLPLLPAGESWNNRAGFTVTSGQLNLYHNGESVTEWKAFLRENPITFLYRTTSYTQKNDIRAEIETHGDILYTLTGEEVYTATGEGWMPGTVSISNFMVYAKPVEGYASKASIVCSHLATETPANVTNRGYQGCAQGGGTSLYLNLGDPYNTKELAVQYIKDQYAAGTPVQIKAKRATPIIYAHPAQPLKNPEGEWTLSAENTPVGYMRALTDADRANHADVADTATTADQLAGQSPAWYMPPGLMAPFAGSTAPAGWLLCDGRTVSRTTYAALFAVIGETFGAGDGNTTFALPNLQGRVAAGTSSSHPLASKAGADSKQITRANLPAEKLNLEDNGIWIMDSVQTGSESGRTLQMGTRSGAARLETNTLGSGTAFDVRQATLYLNYIIKY